MGAYHRVRKLRFWRIELRAEFWTNRYPAATDRLCFRISGHYDCKHRRTNPQEGEVAA